jgi:hypothetical protein
MAAKPIHRLRNVLVRSSQVAKLKLDATFLRRERDNLLMKLGEAALTLLNSGELEQHPALATLLGDARALEEKLDEALRQLEEIHGETGESGDEDEGAPHPT